MLDVNSHEYLCRVFAETRAGFADFFGSRRWGPDSNSPVPMLTSGQSMIVAAIIGNAIDIDQLVQLIS